MEKIIAILEDIWVAAAFAEAGEYDSLPKQPNHRRHDSVARVHAV